MGDKQEEISRGLRRPRGSKQPVGNADWEECDAKLLQRLIGIASFKGGALRFGYTRDGGAYSIGVYYGSDYFTEYIRPGDDINDYLRDLIASFEDCDRAGAVVTKTQKKR